MKWNAKLVVKPSMSHAEGHCRAFAEAVKVLASALITLLGTLGLAASEHVVSLEGAVANDSFSRFSLIQKTRSERFKTEPKEATEDWRRGTLQLSEENYAPIGYLWDKAGALHLDLNRNEDLTDDPGAHYKAASTYSSGSYVYCTFTNVLLPGGLNSLAKSLIMDVSINQRGSQWLNMIGGLKSYKAGRLDLGGTSWQLGFAGPPGTRSGPAQKELLICRLWTERNDHFFANEKDPTTFRRPEKLFLAGKLFKASIETSTTGEPESLKLVEQAAELGELKITGEQITRLVLRGNYCAAVLENPGKSVKVPIAKYDSYSVRLGSAGIKALREHGQQDPSVTVSANTPAVLKAGGPLANTVRAKQRGPMIQLDYELRAADGAAYELPRAAVAPRFTIYEGARKVASGAFEYG